MVEQLATSSLAATQRVSRWCAFGSATLAPLVVRPLDPTSFEASLVRAKFGEIGVARMQTTAAQAHGCVGGASRFPAGLVRSLVLCLQQRGTLLMRQAGREVELHEGDVVLWDLRQEWEQLARADTSLAWCKLPLSCLTATVPDVQSLLALPFRAGRPETALLGSIIANTVTLGLASRGGTEASMAPDLLAAAFNMAVAGRVVEDEVQGLDLRLARRLRTLIDERLADPELSVAGLAGELGMSTRSFQRCFQLNGVTPRSYLLERRLETAAAALRNGGVAASPRITTLALACGFNDPAYFSRVFQRRFGVAPRLYAQRWQRLP
jgi:AraC-like DNA-binding protein